MAAKKRLVLVGAGETAEMAYEYFTDDSDYDVVAFAVEREHLKGGDFLGLPVVCLDSLADRYPPADCSAFIAVSYTGLNSARKRICYQVESMGYELASYVSSRSFIGRGVVVGPNAFIMEQCSVQHHGRVGKGAVLWCGCQIAHRSSIGDFAWLAPGVVVSGFCSIGERSFLGSGAILIDGVSVAEKTAVGAGALVRKALTEPEMLYRADNRLTPMGDERFKEFMEGNI